MATNYTQAAGQFFSCLRTAKTILLISHQNPDCDTLGANLALLQYLRAQGKICVSFCASPVKKEYAFLPLSHEITSDVSVFERAYDAVVAVDSGDLRYAGVEELVRKIPEGFTLLNVDHHPTNENFGNVNIVDTDSASTTEVLFKLFRAEGAVISNTMATCLLAGVATDTSYFSNPATSASAFQVASELVSLGANAGMIAKNVLNTRPIRVLKLWGEIFSRLKMNRFGMAVTVFTEKDMEGFGIGDSFEGVSNFLNNLSGVRAVLVLREEAGGRVRGSFRTSRHDVDVSRLARFFGGGGHKKAAGFSIPGRLTQNEKGEWKIVNNEQ